MSAPGEAHAEQIGWTDASTVIESPHTLPNHYVDETLIEAPPGTRKLRIVFSRIRMEAGYDFISIRDQWGTEIERITGDHDNYVSRSISGDRATIVVRTDGSVKSWGFRISGYEYRGCAIEPVPNPALVAATGCDEVRAAIERAAIEEVRQRFSGGGFYWPGVRTAVDQAREAFSQTNVRTAGIDEGDVAKTDGDYIYSLAGRQLRMFTTDVGERALLRYAVDIEGAPRDLLLAGERVIVLSGLRAAEDVAAPDSTAGDDLRAFVPRWWTPDARTKVTIFDLSTGAPVVVDEVVFEGRYVTSRIVGSSLRMTVRRSIEWPDIDWYPMDVDWGTREYEQRLDELEQQALDAVKARTLAEWLPGMDEADCAAFSLGEIANAQTLTKIVHMDVGVGADEVRDPHIDAGILAPSDIIYQTPSSLYLAGQITDECVGDPLAGSHSYIHMLDISDEDPVEYVASGVVEGSLISEFAIDEEGDFLRVATTNVSWLDDDPGPSVDNRVRVLTPDRGVLEQVGITDPLAPGETMRSVRFIGDRGYVVTFRVVDPLFAIDLSEPTHPQVVGELTIPGFSTYLHPVGDGRLFGLGHDFDEEGVERRGVALSLYDVSETIPVVLDRIIIGTRSGYTPALDEHRAFTIYQPPGSAYPLLAIPFTDWEVDAAGQWRPLSFLAVVQIGEDGLEDLGRIDVSSLLDGADQFDWWSRPTVQRGLFVEDRVYAVSDYGIRAGRIMNPSETVAEVAVAPKQELFGDLLRMEVTAAVWPAAPILDAWLPGTLVPIRVDADIEVEKVAVHVEIEHSAPGDLLIVLIREGEFRVLRAWRDSAAGKLTETYEPDMRGVDAKGDWFLWVVDTVPLDSGTVHSARLDLIGARAAEYGGGVAPRRRGGGGARPVVALNGWSGRSF